MKKKYVSPAFIVSNFSLTENLSALFLLEGLYVWYIESLRGWGTVPPNRPSLAHNNLFATLSLLPKITGIFSKRQSRERSNPAYPYKGSGRRDVLVERPIVQVTARLLRQRETTCKHEEQDEAAREKTEEPEEFDVSAHRRAPYVSRLPLSRTITIHLISRYLHERSKTKFSASRRRSGWRRRTPRTVRRP